jgi:hypothetical protein
MTRNIYTTVILTVMVFSSFVSHSQKANKLTGKEKKDGWVLLFDGKSFDGWRQCNGDAMPANWTIEDDAMKVMLGEGKEPGQGANGDILYGDKKYSNFELSIDWKASEMANSGIFYNIREFRVNQFIMLHPKFRCSIMKRQPIIKSTLIWQVHFTIWLQPIQRQLTLRVNGIPL